VRLFGFISNFIEKICPGCPLAWLLYPFLLSLEGLRQTGGLVGYFFGFAQMIIIYWIAILEEQILDCCMGHWWLTECYTAFCLTTANAPSGYRRSGSLGLWLDSSIQSTQPGWFNWGEIGFSQLLPNLSFWSGWRGIRAYFSHPLVNAYWRISHQRFKTSECLAELAAVFSRLFAFSMMSIADFISLQPLNNWYGGPLQPR